MVGLPIWAWSGAGIMEAWLGAYLETAPASILVHASLDPQARDLSYFQAIALPAGLRLFGAVGMLGLILARTSFVDRVVRMLREASDPRDLAALRMVVFFSLAVYASPWEIGRFAGLPPELIVAPVGWGLLLQWLPPDPSWAVPLAWVFVGLAVAAGAGIAPRITAWGAVTAGIMVLGIPQFYGKINHYHHLIWFAAVLAASPAWDVWTVGWPPAGRKNPPTPRTRPDASTRYGRPLRWIWLLIGLIYFFPGYWKFVVAGPSWVDGTALGTMLQAQWYRVGIDPAVRFDLGALSALAGIAVLTLEIGFVFALVQRGMRSLFVCGAAAFHLAVFLVADINFWTLGVCLVAFVPVGRLLDGKAGQPAVSASKLRPAGRSWVAGGLASLALLAGFTGFDSWPVAVYPTFAGLPDTLYPTLILEVDGQRLDPYKSPAIARAFGPSRVMGLAWQLARTDGPREARAAAVISALARYDATLASGDTVDAFLVHMIVAPGEIRSVREERISRVIQSR
ncbi:MAG: hypothetical protein ACI80V_002235 [Rhodothermales bacterium]|jgi:hypothetical protein